MKKYLKVMLVLVVALSMLCTFALAADPVNPFNIKDKTTATTTGGAINDTVNAVGATVINVVQTIGYVVAVVMLLVVGIQWLIGTPAKKQELKGKLVNVIIGAVLIIAGVSILGMIAKFTKDTEKNIVTSSVEISETYMA